MSEIVDGVEYVTVPCTRCMTHVSVASDALRLADRKRWPLCQTCSQIKTATCRTCGYEAGHLIYETEWELLERCPECDAYYWDPEPRRIRQAAEEATP